MTPSPFTIAWSEASRFYYGSLFRAEAIYGQPFPLPFLHPSRYLLLSLPFWLPGLPIQAHRIFQVLLWLGLTGLTAGLLVRRLGLASPSARWIGSGWIFLFLFQGPVYYHLTLCLIPVLAFFDVRRFWRSLIVVVLASLWAGISRINWWPMPAFLALTLYLLEVPRAGKNLLQYLKWPVWWGLAGGAAALAANRLYIALSGQPDSSSFSSSFSSDLLWNRLMPSPTYAPGILPMIVLLSLPLWLLIGLRRERLAALRWLGLAGMLLVMLAGGLVVSTKIGGGSNLHNLDAYLVLLVTWGAYALCGKTAPEPPAGDRAVPFQPVWLVLLVLAMPFVPLLQGGLPIRIADQADLRAEADQLKALVREKAVDGEVLFIWQRQLLTFELAGEVPLVYNYETVDLMEMAMADNRPYLETFYRELEQGRYALIVSSVQNDLIRPLSDPFSEENNVWVEQVTRPILTWYDPLLTLPHSGTQLLEPKK